MNMDEIKTLLSNIEGAAAGITGSAQNHIIAVAIMQDCANARKKLNEEAFNDCNESDNG